MYSNNNDDNNNNNNNLNNNNLNNINEALRKLEETAAEFHNNSRQLRRAIITQQERISSLLSHSDSSYNNINNINNNINNNNNTICSNNNNNNTIPISEVIGEESVSLYEIKSQQSLLQTSQYQQIAILLQQKAEIAKVWEEKILNNWFHKVVLKDFYIPAIQKLKSFEIRLNKAAVKLQPTRQVWASAPAIIRNACDIYSNNNNINNNNKELLVENEEKKEKELWVRRKRELGIVIRLSIGVIGEYIEQYKINKININNDEITSNVFPNNNNNNDKSTNNSCILTEDQLIEVLNYINNNSADRQKSLGTSFYSLLSSYFTNNNNNNNNNNIYSSEFLHKLQSSPLLKRLSMELHKENGIYNSHKSKEKLYWYQYWTQFVIYALQESSRRTKDIIITRRQQQEGNEARWHSQCANNAAILNQLIKENNNNNNNNINSDISKLEVGKEIKKREEEEIINKSNKYLESDIYSEDAAFNVGECPLSLVVQILQQQQREREREE